MRSTRAIADQSGSTRTLFNIGTLDTSQVKSVCKGESRSVPIADIAGKKVPWYWGLG